MIEHLNDIQTVPLTFQAHNLISAFIAVMLETVICLFSIRSATIQNWNVMLV